VVVRDRRRRGKVALAEFYCSLEEGVSERIAPAVFGFPQGREFPGEQTVWCLLPRYSKNKEPLRKQFFFAPAVFYSCSAPRECTGNCSAGNPPRGNPGLKRTRMDAILKNFKFEISLKLKINVKRDRRSFISMQYHQIG
jgi:hypothetical protein